VGEECGGRWRTTAACADAVGVVARLGRQRNVKRRDSQCTAGGRRPAKWGERESGASQLRGMCALCSGVQVWHSVDLTPPG
jgi:hypothetical protein